MVSVCLGCFTLWLAPILVSTCASGFSTARLMQCKTYRPTCSTLIEPRISALNGCSAVTLQPCGPRPREQDRGLLTNVLSSVYNLADLVTKIAAGLTNVLTSVHNLADLVNKIAVCLMNAFAALDYFFGYLMGSVLGIVSNLVYIGLHPCRHREQDRGLPHEQDLVCRSWPLLRVLDGQCLGHRSQLHLQPCRPRGQNRGLPRPGTLQCF